MINQTGSEIMHIDPCPSRQSETLCTGRTGENKRKHSQYRTENCRCYEMMLT